MNISYFPFFAISVSQTMTIYAKMLNFTDKLSVVRRGLLVACRDLPITFVLLKSFDLAMLRNFDIKTRVYRTEFNIFTLTLLNKVSEKPLDPYYL